MTVEKMPPAIRILLCAAGAIVASLLTACGSGSSSTTPANIRLVNATSTSLTLSLNGGYELAGIAGDNVSGYESVPPGTYTLSVAAVNGSLSSSPQTLGIGSAQNYTTLAYTRGNVVYASTITDNLAVPVAGFTTLDVANVSPDAGPLNVYVLAPGTNSLAGLSPSYPSVQGLSIASTFAAGTYDIIVTGASSQSDVRLTLPGVVFGSSQVGTLGLTSTSGGTLVNGVLIAQGGPAQFYPATQARVRVMSALPTNVALPTVPFAVAATVGTTALATAYAPNPNLYALVNGGSAITALTVTPNGGAAFSPTIPAGAFTAGQDYTILVFGNGASAATTFAVLLADDNLIIPSQASVRLVNAAVAGGSGVTMYVAGTQAASGVLEGTESAYSGVTPATAAQVVLNGGGYNQSTVFGFVSGSVYTVFLYDSTLPPLIFKDR